MTAFQPASPDQAALLDALLGAGHLIDSGVPGVYGQGADFEAIRRGFEALVVQTVAGDGAEQLRFPPVIPRAQIESSGYLGTFPHLAGAVFGFEGTEAQALAQAEVAARHEDWSEHQHMTALMLTPAACYPVYPAVARRGPLPAGGLVVDLAGAHVFRNEPSGDPARLQIFHMHELVRLGAPDEVRAWRDDWRDRALELLRGLGLAVDFEVASDPFFGRPGRMLAANQRSEALKFEITVPITEPEVTAISSFNYHQDHFGTKYGIALADGSPAHTACMAFGQERIVVALLKTHGLDVAAWPDEVRRQLFA